MKPQMKITCNPEYNCYLRKWLQQAGYLDEKNHGIPLKEMDGKTKWFVRQGNDMIWGDTREELVELYGEDSGIMSFCFISATCEDNPILLKHQPSYLNNLRSLPRIERMRLLDGAWLVQEQAAGHYKREWTHPIIVSDIPPLVKIVRAYDTAGSLPSEKYPNPDWTVGILMGMDSIGNIYILDMVRYRDRYAGVVDRMIQTGLKDQDEWGDVVTYIPLDPSAAGKAAADQMAGALMKAGVTVKKNKTANTKNRKLKAFEPFSVVAENGMVYVVKADWNETFHEELEVFDPNVRIASVHDDIVDATADSFAMIKVSKVHRAVQLPEINAPTLLAGHRKQIR